MYASDYAIYPEDPLAAETGAAVQHRDNALATSQSARPVAGESAEVMQPRDLTMLPLIELLLKNRGQLYRMIRDRSALPVLFPRLLAIALAGFVLFGVAMSLVLTATDRWPSLTAIAAWLEIPSPDYS